MFQKYSKMLTIRHTLLKAGLCTTPWYSPSVTDVLMCRKSINTIHNYILVDA